MSSTVVEKLFKTAKRVYKNTTRAFKRLITTLFSFLCCIFKNTDHEESNLPLKALHNEETLCKKCQLNYKYIEAMRGTETDIDYQSYNAKDKSEEKEVMIDLPVSRDNTLSEIQVENRMVDTSSEEESFLTENDTEKKPDLKNNDKDKEPSTSCDGFNLGRCCDITKQEETRNFKVKEGELILQLENKEKELRYYQKLAEDYANHLKVTDTELLQQIKAKEKELEFYRTEFEYKDSLLEAKRLEIKGLLDSINECTEIIKIKDQKLKSLQKSAENQKDIISTQEKELKSNYTKIDEYSVKIESKEKDLEIFKVREREITQQLEALKRDLEFKTAQIERYKQIVEDATAKLRVSNTKTQKYAKENEERSKKSFAKELELTSQVEVISRQLQSSRHAIDDYVKKNKELLNQLESKQEELEVSQNAVNSKKRLLEENQAEFQLLEKKIGEYDHKVTTKDKELEILQESANNSARLFKEKEVELQSSLNAIHDLTLTIQSKDDALDKLESDMEECTKNTESLNKELESYKVKAKGYARELQQKDKELQSLKDLNTEYVTSLEKKDKEFKTFKQVINGMMEGIKENMDVCNDTYTKLREELCYKEQALSDIESDNDLLRKSNNDMEKELEVANCKVEKYLRDVLNMRSELDMLTTQLKMVYWSKSGHGKTELHKTREFIIQGLRGYAASTNSAGQSAAKNGINTCN